MELLAWAIFALFAIGPYVAFAVGVLAVLVFVTRGSFRINRRVGYFVASAITAGAGALGYVYVVRGPEAFAAACNSGVGIRVFMDVKAESYVLTYAPNFANGYLRMTDATLEDAILAVAKGAVRYVEVQDWNSDEHRYGVPGRLAEFRDLSEGAGYFKVFLATLAHPKCRWLLPRDVKMPYGIYLSHPINHEVNQKLRSSATEEKCVALEYVTSASSRYPIKFSINQPISDNLVKHEIRVVDQHAGDDLVGQSVAYEHKTDGVYASVAFWVGSGKQHRTCPMNLLEGRPVHQILKI
jgi:hypothetical protein